ncbi:hypothetical protein OAH18_02815, partial [bacterium]|nr:hypothetical protein [bacterium]
MSNVVIFTDLDRSAIQRPASTKRKTKRRPQLKKRRIAERSTTEKTAMQIKTLLALTILLTAVIPNPAHAQSSDAP